MTEQHVPSSEEKSAAQPSAFASRLLTQARQLYTKSIADVKQRLNVLRDKLKITTATNKPVKKRTLVKIAFGNFRHSWKDAFEGMKLRYFIVPNSKKIDPTRMSWAQGKSIVSILGGAAIGGAIGIHAYAFPYVFVAALYAGAPLLALGVGIRALAVFIPKGEVKNAVKNIGKKTFAAGVICAMWPMVGVGIVAFAGLHAGIVTAETLVKGFGASLRAAYLTVSGKDSEVPTLPVPAAPVPSFAVTAPTAGADFSQAAADIVAGQTAPQETTPVAKPAANKPRSA